MSNDMKNPRQPVRVDISGRIGEQSPQGQNLTPIIYSGTAPVNALSAGRVWMPRGHLAKAHVHHHTELIVYVLDGYAATLWGEDMQPLPQGPNSMVWIPAGVPHTAVSLSETPVVAFEVRTDPTFNDDVELLPHLDEVASRQVESLRREHARESGFGGGNLTAKAAASPSW